VRVRVHGAAEEVWENLKTDGFVESHPNVAKDATLGWGTRQIRDRNGKGKDHAGVLDAGGL
jgi:hypothetical protein